MIIAEIIIKDKDIDKNVRILNSYEECLRRNPDGLIKDKKYNNENEINKCQITINDEPIPFNYFHKFKSEGKYIIKYSFMNYLTKTNQMFRDCKFLKNIDLSKLSSKGY